MNLFRVALELALRLLFRMQIAGAAHLTPAAGRRRMIVIAHDSTLDPLVAFALLGKDAFHVLPADLAGKRHLRWMIAAGLAAAAPTTHADARRLRGTVRRTATLVTYASNDADVLGAEWRKMQAIGRFADLRRADVVAVRFGGLEQSHQTRRHPGDLKRRWLPKLRVTIDPARRLEVPALPGRPRRYAAGRALYFALSELRTRTADTNRTLYDAFRRALRRYGADHPLLTDSTGASFTYRGLAIATQVLGRRLAAHAAPGAALAVMLPNAAATAVTFLALHAFGRVPAMLNYTAGAANLLVACRLAGVRKVVSSRAFVERAQLSLLVEALAAQVEFIWLEDIRREVGLAQKLRGVFDHLIWRPRAKPDDTAVMLFTSGSEGVPKGVALSHANILVNIAQVASRIHFGPRDRLLSVLPVFHSLGLTAGMMLPLWTGVKLHFYPSPLHYKQVPEELAKTAATAFFATDTFLAGYARNADPQAFRSLRLIVSGAEPVRAETRRIYRERYGLQLLEGFGMTEAAPVVAVNTPMFNCDGSVGPVLPLIETRLEPVPGLDAGGLLLLRGPNVMRGYLRADGSGAIDPPHHGWHDSGDVVDIDAEGYVTIRGRVKRFAKIAGEMVSLAAVEALVAQLWPDDGHAAVAVPDQRRGERIVLLTTRAGALRQDVAAFGRTMGAPELMMPSEVIVLDELPVLGTGKTDHVAARKMAFDRLAP